MCHTDEHDELFLPKERYLQVVEAIEFELVGHHDLLIEVVFFLFLDLVHRVIEVVQLVLTLAIVLDQVISALSRLAHVQSATFVFIVAIIGLAFGA